MGIKISATLLLSVLMSMVPAAGVTVYVPDVVDRALALEKEGLKHATLVATEQLIESFNRCQNMVVGWEVVVGPNTSEQILAHDVLGEVTTNISPEGVSIKYCTSHGTVHHEIRFDPTRTYLIIYPPYSGLLHTVPVEPVHMGKELGLVVIQGGKVYELNYHELPPAQNPPPGTVTLSRAVELMGDWDLLVRLEIDRDTVALDLVKSDGSGAYRVVCDLRTGRAWREPLPPEDSRRLIELAREDLEKIRLLKEGRELESPSGLRTIVYDATEGKVLLVLASPTLEYLREHAPKLAGLIELLRNVYYPDGFLKWDYFQLSARARELTDLLETTGLAGTKCVRWLLHPELVLSSYLLVGGLGLAASLAWIELLKHFPRLEKAPEFRWDLPTILEYAKRLAYTGILYGLEAYGLEVIAWSILTDLVLKLLGLWDYTVGGRILDAVRGAVWAPLIEEPTKRLASELSGLPRSVAGAWFGLLEAVDWGEIGPNGVQVANVVDRVGAHIVFAVSPLPIGALLHSLDSAYCNFGDEFLDYWPGVLGPILAVLGALIEHALTGVW